MAFDDGVLFDAAFLGHLRALIGKHHKLYPAIPPQGIYFESLVERAFLSAGWPRSHITLENPNSPKADIRVGKRRLSLKTETGKVTRETLISITKLCTTETGEWVSEALIKHALAHLTRYEGVLMLRAVWTPKRAPKAINYQLVEIPIGLLEKMSAGEALAVGRRKGRRSLGFDVMDGDDILFHVHFDGADGKCQIRKLPVDRCIMLDRWQQPLAE